MANIFEQDRRREFLRQIRIETQDMLNLYCLVKSVDLHIRGEYDITKYGRLQRLKSESFDKESADLKQAVLIIYQTVTCPKWMFYHSCLCAIEFYLEGEPRSTTCRKVNFCPEKVGAYHLMGSDSVWVREGCFDTKGDGSVVSLSPLFENEVLYINNFKKLMRWYNNESGAVNADFIRS